jgi:hypothetical protein
MSTGTSRITSHSLQNALTVAPQSPSDIPLEILCNILLILLRRCIYIVTYKADFVNYTDVDSDWWIYSLLDITITKNRLAAERRSIVVKALCYKPEGRGFETR